MCGLCGALGAGDHWSKGVGDGVVRTSVAERHRQTAAANAVLRHFGLTLKVWNDRYILYGRTGRSAVVDHMGALWAAAETLGGIIDPLAASLVDHMERR